MTVATGAESGLQRSDSFSSSHDSMRATNLVLGTVVEATHTRPPRLGITYRQPGEHPLLMGGQSIQCGFDGSSHLHSETGPQHCYL